MWHRLSHYLNVVRDGQEVTVTDYGRAVARLVPLDEPGSLGRLIGEPSSATCVRLWNEATRNVSVRLSYPEARAALARAERMGRITTRRHTAASAELARSSRR